MVSNSSSRRALHLHAVVIGGRVIGPGLPSAIALMTVTDWAARVRVPEDGGLLMPSLIILAEAISGNPGRSQRVLI